jgi:RNA recognition motif-containing protein
MKVYVGNLLYETEDAELAHLFDEFGGQGARIARDETGRSRGYGFVILNDVVADAAIAKLDGAEFLGRRIFVSRARLQGKQ